MSVQIQTCEMIAIAQRSLKQCWRHLRLMTNQCQVIGVVRARQNVPLITALLKCQVKSRARSRRSARITPPSRETPQTVYLDCRF